MVEVVVAAARSEPAEKKPKAGPQSVRVKPVGRGNGVDNVLEAAAVAKKISETTLSIFAAEATSNGTRRFLRKFAWQRLLSENEMAVKTGISPDQAFELLSESERAAFGCLESFVTSAHRNAGVEVHADRKRPHERVLKLANGIVEPPAGTKCNKRDALLKKKVAWAKLATDKCKELRVGLDAKSAFHSLSADSREAFGSVTNFIRSLSSCDIIKVAPPQNPKRPPPPEKRLLKLVDGKRA